MSCLEAPIFGVVAKATFVMSSNYLEIEYTIGIIQSNSFYPRSFYPRGSTTISWRAIVLDSLLGPDSLVGGFQNLTERKKEFFDQV